MKLTLTYINRTERQGKKGPYTSVSIKAKEYNDKFLSGFGNKTNENWKVGDEVEVAEVKEVSKDGKIYLNFEMPKATGGVNPKQMEEILNLTFSTNFMVKALFDHFIKTEKKEDNYPTAESEGITKMPFEDDNLGFDQFPEAQM